MRDWKKSSDLVSYIIFTVKLFDLSDKKTVILSRDQYEMFVIKTYSDKRTSYMLAFTVKAKMYFTSVLNNYLLRLINCLMTFPNFYVVEVF